MPEALPSVFLALTGFVVSTIAGLGYLGIFFLMTVEGIITPIPSELVLPFAGYLAAIGELHPVLIVLVATAGSTLGSTVAYYIGYYAGRPLIQRYGRIIRLGEEDVQWAEEWFEKYGDWGNLIGHAVPGVRSFISFPAGIGKMDMRRYLMFTALGSAIWNTVLVAAGFFLLDRWMTFAETTENVDLYVLLVATAAVVGYLYWRKGRNGPKRKGELKRARPGKVEAGRRKNRAEKRDDAPDRPGLTAAE